MAVKIIMPKQGLQMTEGTIIEWKKQVGDKVKEGETLLEIETDKLNIDIDAPATGTILALTRKEGETVPITETIGIIGDEGEDIAQLLAETGTAAPEQSAPSAPVPGESAKEEPGTSAAPPARAPGERLLISPRARKAASDMQLDPASIAGSGPDGMIIERDIIAASKAKPSYAATPVAHKLAAASGQDLQQVSGSGPRGKIYSRDLAAAPAGEAAAEPEKLTMSTMRRTIASRMRTSLDEAAQAVHRIDLDMSEAARVREQFRAAGKKISYNDIILKAVAASVKRHPAVNRQMVSNDTLLQYRDVNVGVAVALEDGLIVPVIRNADRLSLEQIAAESRRLSEAARNGSLQPDDLSQGRLTVSNLGMFGIDSFTAIINRPESSILAVGAVKEQPAAVDGAVVIRPMCSISLTYDHRVIDGAPAALFLQTLRSLLEAPYLLL
jgi:pyruvate dehydrogenase E2 component (dihydrolipoamide acetyltransferase)